MDYATLKQNLITSLNRSDLTAEVDSQIQEVIRGLQRDWFYISAVRQTLPTVVGQVFYDIPTDMVSIDFVRLLYANTWQFLRKVEYDYLLILDTNNPSSTSPPLNWSPFDSKIRIYPAPDQIYTLELTGNQKIPVPATDATTNFWTEGASELVKYLTLAQIYQTRINDPARAQQMAQVAEAHRRSLKSESVLKACLGRVQAHW